MTAIYGHCFVKECEQHDGQPPMHASAIMRPPALRLFRYALDEARAGALMGLHFTYFEFIERLISAAAAAASGYADVQKFLIGA